MTHFRFRFIYLLLCVCLLSGGNEVFSQNRNTRKTESTRKTSQKKQASARKSVSKKSGAKKETSADVKRRQQETQREIEQTKARIAETDREISVNLANLNKLQGNIAASKKAVANASAQVRTIEQRISRLHDEISESESQIRTLRDEYLKAIKKMRARKGTNSDLAFIFSSKNFNQAMRRMRYLSQFSAWRTAQSNVLDSKVKSLREDQRQLALDKARKDEALKKEAAAQSTLQKQFAEQDAIVVELRKNSSALKRHLSAKQAEANSLKNRISALIAEEQARAEEQRRKEELARKEKERKEREAAEQLERERQLAQAEAARLQKDNSSEKEKSKERKRKENNKKKNNKKDSRKENANERNYAEARNRAPKSESSSGSVAKASEANGSNFERLKGSLPRPVSGHFRITSRFGRHPLPELPDVMYDNPGIDAEVSKGAQAQAVASGKVTGVYVIPGYNTVVIVSHGNYYSVYGNLASPSVSVGQSLRQGQTVGTVAAMEDDSSRGSIHFEIWKNREKLNPQNWIQ